MIPPSRATLPSSADRPHRSGARAALISVLPLLALLAGLPGRAGQGAAEDPVVLEGRVVRGADSVPVPGQRVVLHRVDPEGGAPVDSLETGSGGSFAFRFPAPADDVVHLASTRFDGVRYFGPAVHGGRVPDGYVVRVWRAEPAGSDAPVRVRRRMLVLTADRRSLQVMDVIDVAGRAGRTLVAPGGGGEFWWEVPVPRGAREVEVLPGGVDRADVRIAEGRARVSADIPPTGQRVTLGYRLPAGRELTLIPGGRTERVEVVARGGPGRVAVEGLGAARTSDVGGESVRRWVGAGTDTVRVRTAGAGEGIPTVAWIAAAVGVLLAAAAAVAWRRGTARRGGGRRG